jgi:hypothetical protein
MATQTPELPKKKRARSPNFPAITLKDAVERARTIFKEEGRNFAHEDTILGHWQYKPRSGGGWSVLAAVKSFGLVTQEGSGNTSRYRVSDSALKLVMKSGDEHADERQDVLKDAALKPRIHRELWTTYSGTLPSNQTLEYELVSNWGFTPVAAKEFVPRFRETISYAALTAADTLTGNGGDNGDDANEFASDDPFRARSAVTTPSKVVKAPPGSATRFDERISTESSATTVIPILLPGVGQAGALKLPTRMSEAEWNTMLAIIAAYKPTIVQLGPSGREPEVPKPASQKDPSV